MKLNELKRKLEEILCITKWSPTERQLFLISEKIKTLPANSTKNDLSRTVIEIAGSYESRIAEGVDTSDLTTLLMLAQNPQPK